MACWLRLLDFNSLSLDLVSSWGRPRQLRIQRLGHACKKPTGNYSIPVCEPQFELLTCQKMCHPWKVTVFEKGNLLPRTLRPSYVFSLIKRGNSWSKFSFNHVLTTSKYFTKSCSIFLSASTFSCSDKVLFKNKDMHCSMQGIPLSNISTLHWRLQTASRIRR